MLSTQKDAWTSQVDFLRESLVGSSGTIFFEFVIPRMGRRIDAVLLIGPVVFVLEFKVGEVSFDRASVDQVWDYALDLKNFHEASHSVSIVPILIATNAPESERVLLDLDEDGVYRPVQINGLDLRKTIDQVLIAVSGSALVARDWASCSYRPTPTIIEAARSLYSKHSVEEIARFDAGARNLRQTSRRVEELVEYAKKSGEKLICFVTGVPGAGKTLVGLNIATNRRDESDETHAVFLSGNGPLVAVLTEALARDEFARSLQAGNTVRIGKIRESIKAFIQNVHHFRDDALVDPSPPVEHVVIFDEAQRAWNLRQTASFMSRKKGIQGFSQSEPEFLVSCLDRRKDWAVIVCLVGGGQEINVGEAGIGAWLDAVKAKFPHWKLYISSKLSDSEYAAGNALDGVCDRANSYLDDDLHLSVSMRSFRAENVSLFVKTLLDCDGIKAKKTLDALSAKYPIVITRDLKLAKTWIRSRARGSERFGLIASSKAQRLKPHAIDIRVNVDPVHWFLNDRDDTRSSFYLEDAATEFQVQGLELDWACVTWDGDLRYLDGGWTFHDFRGSRWTNIKSQENQEYLRNAYRVLLTRARQGMVIFVPQGEDDDPTRASEFYDPTYKYLSGLGIPELH